MKFNGNYKELEAIITAMNRTIVFSTSRRNMHQIITHEGEIINLLNTGSLMVQAAPEIKQRFKSDFKHYTTNYKADSNLLKNDKLFIVYDDKKVKKQLKTLLEEINITKFFLSNYKEKDFHDIKNDLLHCKTGIVLLTENDDLLLKKLRTKLRNMVPVLGKNNIIVLGKEEIITDKKLCKDMYHIPFSNNIEEALPHLTYRLENIGFN